jgi:hypothetical protein
VNQPGPSSLHYDRLWKLIWKIPLPTKVRNFMWRLARDIIPTRFTLRKRWVILDIVRPLCLWRIVNRPKIYLCIVLCPKFVLIF